MAATATCMLASNVFRPSPFLSSCSRLLALSTGHGHGQSSTADTTPTPTPTPRNLTENGRRLIQKHKEANRAATPFMEEAESDGSVSLKDFFELAQDLARSSGSRGGGPPRWFSPLECSSRLDDSPVLLYLPGIDGTGAGLALQHKRLGKMFDIWCLHIPVMDRTSFTGLVTMVERTIRSESNRCPNRPIYVVGESLGACIALAVAARNPNIDLVLILTNPATSFNELPFQSLTPLLEMVPDQVQFAQPFLLSLMRGDPLKVLRAASEKGKFPMQTLAELSKDILTMSSYIPVLADILPKRTLLWKLQMLKSASVYTNSRLHAVKAQILFLMSGNDQLLPSPTECSRLRCALTDCEIRKFEKNGHFLFLEDDINLATIIKGTGFYRRRKNMDFIADYLPPTYSEFTKIYESSRFINEVTGPVMMSTLEDGTIIRGLDGIPLEGPVLIVGYHMLLGLEVVPLIAQLLAERNILVRGAAHPMLFAKYKEEGEGSSPDPSIYDVCRMMGAVPVSGSNLYKLFKNKSHVLLYPGGVREALHKKGEQYKLFWPEQAEFVRMAARFGAKIVPFGAVGEDDFGEVVVDLDDMMKIPFFRDQILKNTEDTPKLRTDATGEVAVQFVHMPGIIPKIPGRFYYVFGKPIDTKGWKMALRDREKSHELYLEVKSEVEKCLAYLKENRDKDPYRSIFSRLIYQTIHGPKSQVPTFELLT